MQRAVGAEAEAILAQRDVAGIIAVEIFSQDLIGALADARTKRVADTDAFPGDSKGHLMPRLMPRLLWFSRIGSSGEPRLSRFDANAIRPEPYRGTGRRKWRELKVRYQACSACRVGAGPTKECASPRDIWLPCGGRYQRPICAIVHDRIVRQDRSWRSASINCGCGGGPLPPNAPRRHRPTQLRR